MGQIVICTETLMTQPHTISWTLILLLTIQVQVMDMFWDVYDP